MEEFRFKEEPVIKKAEKAARAEAEGEDAGTEEE